VSSPDRYSRQTRFTPLGPAGQQRLSQSRVAIVGCGALGAVQAASLARAGVGHLRLIDRDIVELSNLQRQFLFTESDAAAQRPKAAAAAHALAQANSQITLEPHVTDLNPANIEDLLEQVDLVLDATDNFETRYLVNDFCVERGIPWIYGAAVGAYGLAFPILPNHGPCLRCVYPDPPSGTQPTCETAGVLNTITSTIATWQSALATRLLTTGTASLPHTIATFDTWDFKTRQIPITRDPQCPCCAARRFEYLDGRVRAPISLCGRNAVQIHERLASLDLHALELQLAGLGTVRRNDFALRFEPDSAHELTIFPDGRAIIKGTTNVGIAKSLYAKYLGR
jgi:adenylyltransferase/sulfurtransferase